MTRVPLLSTVAPVALLAALASGSAALAAPAPVAQIAASGTAGAGAAQAVVVDRVGDVDVVTGNHPNAPDVTEVRYQASKTTLRVTIHATHIAGENRVRGHEEFSVAVYPGAGRLPYTIHAHRGQLRLLDLDNLNQNRRESRIGGSLTVNPGRDVAVFRIPMRAVGNPAKVAVSGAAYLGTGNLEGWGEVWSLDFSKRGDAVVPD